MIISLRKLNNKSDLFELRRAPAPFGHLSNLKFLICDGHPSIWESYGEAMGRPWRGYGKLWGGFKVLFMYCFRL